MSSEQREAGLVSGGAIFRWALSIGLGAAVGFGAVKVFPPGVIGTPAQHGPSSLRVKEVQADGAAFECLPDGTRVAWQPEGTNQPPAPGRAHFAAPVALCIPFIALLACIALMPLVNARFWAHHYPAVSFFLASVVVAYYLGALGGAGRAAVLHAAIEYYSFIALVGGLYIVSGGILIDIRTRAGPLANTALLAVGALLANVVGTTGASMLLIRPFMRMNKGRLRPIHVVMFIFIVSNCGGCLTPIGDPPLYLGYLRGVPFLWTGAHLWPMWLVCTGLLLAVFFVIDTRVGPARAEHLEISQGRARDPAFHPVDIEATHIPLTIPHRGRPVLAGVPGAVCLALLVASVFIDPALKSWGALEGWPVGATVQILLATAAYFLTRPSIRHANGFNFHPVQEVAFLFAGIFMTMIPALAYLEANGARLGVTSPGQFYFATGLLSAVLDNAPTYLSFLQAAMGILHLPPEPAGVARFIANDYEIIHAAGGIAHFSGQALLEAISLAAVFFGAMTYIGNGPNFMVRAIAEGGGLKMPSFLGYVGLAAVILLPVLVVVWAIFVR